MSLINVDAHLKCCLLRDKTCSIVILNDNYLLEKFLEMKELADYIRLVMLQYTRAINQIYKVHLHSLLPLLLLDLGN